MTIVTNTRRALAAAQRLICANVSHRQLAAAIAVVYAVKAMGGDAAAAAIAVLYGIEALRNDHGGAGGAPEAAR